MKTWAIFDDSFRFEDEEAPPPIVNILGGAHKIGTRPPEARIGYGANGEVTFFSTEKNWRKVYDFVAQHDEAKLFTTAPAEVLRSWLEAGAVGLTGSALNITITRAHDPARGASFSYGYRQYGPYWRRFLTAANSHSQSGQKRKTVDFGDPPADSWPVYFNPRMTDVAPVDEHTVHALLNNEHSILLPPWEEEPASESYFSINQGRNVGVTARNHLRWLTGRDRWTADEPALITLWRAMDDAALRPDMLAGAQIEIEGLPPSTGKVGSGTTAALKIQPANEEAAFATRFRHRLLFRGTHPISEFAKGVREAVLSDLCEALGPKSTITLAASDIATVGSFSNDGLSLKATPDDAIFAMLRNWEVLDKKAGDVLSGSGDLPFSLHCHTGGIPAGARAVRHFWQWHLLPASAQVFVSLAWWERYPFLDYGCSHELTHKEMRDPAERLDSSCYAVSQAEDARWHVEAAPQNFGDVMYAALMMPLGTRIFWGGMAILDYPKCLLDVGTTLG